MNLIQSTAIFSLLVQFVTGIIDIIGLNFHVSSDAEIFRTLLKIELTVQVIEFIMYTYLIHLFSKNGRTSNAIVFRYADWFFTTPIMMISLMAYLSGEIRFNRFLKKYSRLIIFIIVMDILMLIAGIQNELFSISNQTPIILCSRRTWVYIGFFPFMLMFGTIYHVFHRQLAVSREKRFIFTWFLIIWTFYGLVAFGSYTTRNVSYNLLDILSKNITGLLLVWKLAQYRIKK